MKFGIIGAGNHAQRKVMPAIVKAGHEVSAIYSRNVEKAKKIGLKYLSKPYDDLETFFTGGFEAVYIASPNHLHFDHAIAALKRKKHVLLEKQMTLRTEHAEELVRFSQKQGLSLKIGFHLRFHPAVMEIRKLVLDGSIGKPVYSMGMWAYKSTGKHTDPDNRWWDEDDKAGGGSVMGTGVHVIDTFNYIFSSRPVRVSATRYPEKKVIDRSESVYMDYGKHSAVAVSSRDMEHPDNSLRIYGTEGSIVATNLFGVDVDTQLYINGKKKKSFSGVNMYEGEVRSFYASTMGEPSEIADASDGLEVVKIVNGAFDGDYTGRWSMS